METKVLQLTNENVIVDACLIGPLANLMKKGKICHFWLFDDPNSKRYDLMRKVEKNSLRV